MVTDQRICLYGECHTCYQDSKIWKFNCDINLFFMCRGRKIDEMVTKMQFYFESISFKVQCVPTESFHFFHPETFKWHL